MRNPLIEFAVLSFTCAMPLAAKEPCPLRPAGSLPWAIAGLMDGDQYADVYLSLNSRGRATACSVGMTNIPGDDKFWICRAYLDQWNAMSTHATAALTNRTVKQQWVRNGAKHLDAEKAARRDYFLKHPSERPECYKEDPAPPGPSRLSI